MDKVTMTKEQFEKAIKNAFKKGESWGCTYSTWFCPTESDTKEKIETAIKSAYQIINDE